MKLTVKEAYEQGITEGVMASENGTPITGIQKVDENYYLIQSPNFKTKLGYKVRATYLLWVKGRQPKAPKPPKVEQETGRRRGQARTIQLTEKGLAACEAMDREAGRK